MGHATQAAVLDIRWRRALKHDNLGFKRPRKACDRFGNKVLQEVCRQLVTVYFKFIHNIG